MFQVLDLFSGIGGFSLGLESTGGFDTVAFCECDKKARLVLDKHWPDVPKYEDVKELTLEQLRTDGIVPDVICGGFPCQDISAAGKGEGIVGERSGLWSEMFRLIRDVRPSWAIIENVSALRSKGLTLVLQNLCEIGYCAEWHCIPASAVGAPHQRDRIWIVAYPDSQRGCSRNTQREDARHVGQSPIGSRIDTRRMETWDVEPNVGRVANGVPNRVDRLKQLGNAVVPQIPHLIGKAILEREEAMNAGTNTR